MYLFNIGGQPTGRVVMIRIEELSLKQARRYVFLYVNGIEFYHVFVKLALQPLVVNL